MPINLHPATVHFPIAFLLLASGAGLLYMYWRPLDVLRTLTWWPMLLGWLGALVAILTGLLAQSGLPPEAPYRALGAVWLAALLAVAVPKTTTPSPQSQGATSRLAARSVAAANAPPACDAVIAVRYWLDPGQRLEWRQIGLYLGRQRHAVMRR